MPKTVAHTGDPDFPDWEVLAFEDGFRLYGRASCRAWGTILAGNREDMIVALRAAPPQWVQDGLAGPAGGYSEGRRLDDGSGWSAWPTRDEAEALAQQLA